MTPPTPPPVDAPVQAPPADAARAAAIDALQAWARNRDQLPELRADLLALAWHTGNRNIRELARLADVSRDTVYADLRGRGIDAADRAADATPRFAPLAAATVAGLADLVSARVAPAMLIEHPDPAARIAWLTGIVLDRIGTLLATPAGTVTDLENAPVVYSRADLLQDVIDRAAFIADDARQELAVELTDTQVADRTAREQENTLGGALEPVVDAATLRLSLPNGNAGTITVELTYRDRQLIQVHSDSPLVTGQLDRDAHLGIHAALDAIAHALRPALSERAYFEDE